jgi:hypothetical protein
MAALLTSVAIKEQCLALIARPANALPWSLVNSLNSSYHDWRWLLLLIRQ